MHWNLLKSPRSEAYLRQAGPWLQVFASVVEASTPLRRQRSTEERLQNGFLHIHAIFRLLEHDGLRAIENFAGDF